MPAQLDLGLSLAFAGQANAFGVDSDRVVGTVDGDLTLEYLVENGGHVRRIPLPEARASDFALARPRS